MVLLRFSFTLVSDGMTGAVCTTVVEGSVVVEVDSVVVVEAGAGVVAVGAGVTVVSRVVVVVLVPVCAFAE